ncbi:hypothetical protein [Candidatus Reidiella endopervernicosa]|uniref:EexN family lipoprotein n=1 Tax=Candidatus Reidiella endopervernicosa TaxID=2738883 RepID=A0A6N0HSE7_9GAMM|nr:hypothetical protein [Candidatus Reidiella endopervernicosa]QKQ25117.1 hypothetical protein HUE57_01565 [Candidatus Reidiella endopervernicosa]
MRLLTLVTTLLLLSACGSGTSMSGLSDTELEYKAAECTSLGGSNRIMAMTCDEVEKECLYRNKQGKQLCPALL